MTSVRPAEDPSELLARKTLEALLDVQLTRVPGTDRATHDYEHVTDAGLSAIEVKEIVSSDYLEVQAVLDRQSFWASTTLTKQWSVGIDTPTTVDQFTPALIRGLAADIEKDLAILEAAGITCTRGAFEHANGESYAALWRISRRTNDSICMSSALMDDRGPGIQLDQWHGYVRTGRADAFAERVQAWLDSPASANLRASLSNADARRRDGVLVFDPLTEPEYHSAQETESFCPQSSLELGNDIDRLWCILHPAVFSFAPSEGWQRWPPANLNADGRSAPTASN